MNKTASNNKQKTTKQLRQVNVLESLKDISSSTAKNVKNLGTDISKEFLSQLFGLKAQNKFSGEIQKGESLEVNKVFSGKYQEEQKLRNQLTFERRVRDEEKALLQQKSNDLRLQLHAITAEIAKVVAATPKLAQQIEFASIAAPSNPGIYHLRFFEKLLTFIRSFRKKIENASIWLTAVNKRAKKQTFWSQYQAKKGQRLLSPEDYLQRSAA